MPDSSNSPPPSHRLYQTLVYLFDRNFWKLVSLLLVANFALSILVIRNVKYTEIDWKAYMQEVAGVLEDKQFDYVHLRGDTGPLVYPAGFVWLYSFLYRATDSGTLIKRAQYIFAGLHTGTCCVAIAILRLALPRPTAPLAVSAIFLSRRAMSLFVLRLFNDAPQTLLTLLFVFAAMRDKWNDACIAFTVALSIKMNALLYAPGLALLLCQARGVRGAVRRLFGLVLIPQLIIATPFLYAAPGSYFSRAFELSRVFLHRWSVNGAFLDNATFQGKPLAVALLAAHLCTLLAFGQFRWTQPASLGLFGLIGLRKKTLGGWKWEYESAHKKLLPSHVATVLFTSNFIGIVFARTLHYQFYLWYVSSIPLLVFITNLPIALKIVIPILIERAFNVYPPRSQVAIGLHMAHFALLGALLALPRPGIIHVEAKSGKKRKE